jgi:hypothetical protein
MKAAALAGDDPARAVALVEEVTTLAASAHNQFILAFTSGVLAAAAVGSGRSSDEALWTSLGVADEFQRTGGTAHARSGLWTVLPLLTGLGRQDEAALALGGCVASGIPKLAVQALPHELNELQAGRGPTRHQQLRSLGARISLAELLRILTRQQPAPTPQ